MKRGTWGKSSARTKDTPKRGDTSLEVAKEHLARAVIRQAIESRGGIMDRHSEKEIVQLNRAIDVLVASPSINLELSKHEQTQLATWISVYRLPMWKDGQLISKTMVGQEWSTRQAIKPGSYEELRDKMLKTLTNTESEAERRARIERYGVWSDDD